MTQPQSAILSQRQDYARFLVLKLNKFDLATLKKQLQAFFVRRHVLRRHLTNVNIYTSISFGPELWDKLSKSKPAGFHKLKPIDGAKKLPVLDADILVHIMSSRPDPCFMLAEALLSGWGKDVKVLDEQDCFKHYDGRDLTGFVDGIENPFTDEERKAATMLEAKQPKFANGSFVFATRFIHKMDKWNALPVTSQEKTMGRSKLQSIEMDDAVKPKNAHIARSNTGTDILRQSMPYGSASGPKGLYFIAYTNKLDEFDIILSRMYGTAKDKISDHLLDFTAAQGAAYYFTPSQDLLNETFDIQDD